MKKKKSFKSNFLKKSERKQKRNKIKDINRLLEDERYKVGKFRRNEKGYGFVNIGDDANEIFITQKFTQNALNDDEVLIKIFDKQAENNLRQEGEILKIIKHDRNVIVGTYKKSPNFGFVIP